MRDFTTGSITKPLITFAAPMVVGNLFQQLYSMVDAMVVGRYVGGGALAAVGVSMNVVIFLTSALIGLTTGAAVVLAQFFGAKQHDKLKDAVSVSIIFLAGLSVALTVLGIWLAPPLLRLLDTSEEIFSDALLYMRILLGGMLFPIFYNMYAAYLRALGDTRRPLYILILTVVVNLVLDIYFVVVLKMGVAGAGIATILAQVFAAVMCFIYTYRRVPLLKVSKLTFDRELFSLILKYGIPAALQLSLVSLATLAITRLMNSFGDAVMAGVTAVGRIDQLAIMPISTLSLALSTFVAQNIGADLEERARKGLRVALILMLICAVLMSALLMAFAPQIISLFLNKDDVNSPEILRVGQMYIKIMVIFYFMFAILFAFNGFFRGVGDAVMAMAFPVISLAIRTASAYALVGLADMGPEALAWSIPIGWGLSSIASWIYYKKRLWVGKVVT